MKLFKNLLAGVLMLTATSAMALDAKEVGNGGNAVLCPATKSAELLDYYEARILRSMNVQMGSAKDPVAVAQFVVQRFKKLSPLRALAYEKYIQSFMSESRFLKDVELIEVNDSGHIFLPNNCKIVQTALQKSPEFPGDGRYIINQDVWDQMPVTSQAGLILHEVIYREALEFGAYDSRAVRYLNSILAADQLAAHTLESFNKMMYDIGFKAFEAFGTVLVSDGTSLNIILDQSEFFKAVRPSQVDITGYTFNTKVPGSIIRDESGNEIKISGSFITRWQGQDLSLNLLEYYEGNPGMVRYVHGNINRQRIEFGFQGIQYTFYNLIRSTTYSLEFNRDGVLKKASGSLEITNGKFKTPGILTITEPYYLSDYGFPSFASGTVPMYFAAPTKVITDHGELVFKGGNPEAKLELYANGTVKEGYLEGYQKFDGSAICGEGVKVRLNEKGMINFSDLENDQIRGCIKNKH